jgi:hypothetical protein
VANSARRMSLELLSGPFGNLLVGGFDASIDMVEGRIPYAVRPEAQCCPTYSIESDKPSATSRLMSRKKFLEARHGTMQEEGSS